MGLFGKRKEKVPTRSEEELRLHRCAFTGHRPQRLYGLEGNIIRELRKAIEAAIADGYTTFLSGGSWGVDLWAADIVLEIRRTNKDIKLILVIPFEGFENRWPADWVKHYRLVRKQADWEHIIAPTYSAEVYQKRNRFLVNHASRLIAVWDGTPSGTKNTVDYARSQGIPVFQIEV